MRHPAATRGTDSVASARRIGDVVVGSVLSVLGLLTLAVLVIALAPQLLRPVLVALSR